jgi:hypothetical protein
VLAHNVYFTLKDASQAERERLVAACRKHLTGHPGIVAFACGVRAEQLKRVVNDLEFHVSLHILFQSQADHDAYQDAPRHERFVDECQQNWARARVFDSEVITDP